MKIPPLINQNRNKKRNPKLKFLLDQLGHEDAEANGMNPRALVHFLPLEVARLSFSYNWGYLLKSLPMIFK